MVQETQPYEPLTEEELAILELLIAHWDKQAR
jgi:hypothetical protein